MSSVDLIEIRDYMMSSFGVSCEILRETLGHSRKAYINPFFDQIKNKNKSKKHMSGSFIYFKLIKDIRHFCSF